MDEAASPSGMSRGAMIVPVAHIGALSQAWFDALGLARPRETPTRQSAAVATPRAKPAAVPLPTRVFDTPQAIAKAPHADMRSAPRSRIASASTIFERSPRKIVRKGASAPAQGGANDVLRRSAGRIVIHTTRGSVKMLVQRDNARLVITAVCDSKVAGTIAAALEAARGHLRARGIVANVHTYGENAA